MPLGRSHLLSILVVVLVQLGAEGLIRTWGYKTHADRGRLHSFAQQSRELSAQSGMRAAFVGNSLTVGGYGDFGPFLNSTRKAGYDNYHCQMLGLYGSTLAEWFYTFKHNYIDAGRPLDVLVVNLSPNSGEDPGPSYPRIAWLPEEGGLTNLPEITTWAFSRAEQRGEYLTASLLSPFAYRAELRCWIHAPIIYRYFEGWQRMNNAMKAIEKPATSNAPVPSPGYNMLRRLMRLGREHGTCVVFVAMPISYHYELDAELIRTIREEGMYLIDAREMDGLTADKFADGWHLSKAGAGIFAAHIGRQLPPIVAAYRSDHAK
jgi:hypothetical protein